MKSYIKNANVIKKERSEKKSKADVKQKASKLKSDIFLAQEVKDIYDTFRESIWSGCK